MSCSDPILRVADLRKDFVAKGAGRHSRRRVVHAVGGVNLEIARGETLGIVGESGSGKTTLARLIMRLVDPTSGMISFEGRDITRLGPREMKGIRRHMQMVFQDPYSSLNPRKTVFAAIAEPLEVHRVYSDRAAKERRVVECLALVELSRSEHFAAKIPAELSGGERQRVGIARALVLGPEFILADEPVSMLDASVKAGITDLMVSLKEKIGLTYVFITHEIALANSICDRIAVMYLGKIVELASAGEIVRSPLHQYTKLLMEAIPPLYPNEEWGRSVPERGEFPFSLEEPVGCSFRERCPGAAEACRVTEPELVDTGGGHFVACHTW
ncbi:MAG: ABC transporter ATP-binding protein [Thermoleophilia bacterium]